MQPAKGLSIAHQVLYLIFFTSLVCSFRAVSSISIALILVAGIVKNKLETKSFFHKNINNIFLQSCVLLFLMHIAGLLYTRDIQEGWNDVRLSSGLLFTPLAVSCTNYINAGTRKKLLSGYCLVLAIASLYCLFNAAVHYFQSGDPSVFFYHSLVRPFNQHAVYFAILVFIAILFLMEGLPGQSFIAGKYIHLALILFFSVVLFLLSSKLIILFYLLYLFYYFIVILKNRSKNRSLAILAFLFLITISAVMLVSRNPVSNRFYDIMEGDLQVIKQEQFSPGSYFNGLQFRLLQWKFTGQVLTEQHSWGLGVSPGDAQALLNQQYISAKMYTGEPGKSGGYLGYNTHNQFLQTLLESGIAGLIILLMVSISLVRIAWLGKKRMLSIIVILLLIWLLSESALETQFGIVIFTFFPLFFSLD